MRSLEAFADSVRAALKPDLSSNYEPLPYLDGIVDELEQVYSQMLPHIKDAEYSLIVCDANSGTIPALALKRIIDSEYLKKELPATSIVSPDRGTMDPIPDELVEEIESFVNEAQALRPGTKALIVTEHIGTGKHVQDLAQVLNSLGIEYDVATITLRATPEYYKNMGAFPLQGSDIFYGGYADKCAISDLTEKERLKGERYVPVLASQILFLHSVNEEKNKSHSRGLSLQTTGQTDTQK